MWNGRSPRRLAAWMARRSRAQPHIWPGRRSLHYTPSDSPFQPSSWGAELTGPLTQAAWGVLTRGRGGGCPVSPASIPQLLLLPSAASALSVACTLTALPAPGLLSTEGCHLPLSRSRFCKSWLLLSGFHRSLASQSDLGGAIWMSGWSHLLWEMAESRVLRLLCVTWGCSLPVSGPRCPRGSKETGAVRTSQLSWLTCWWGAVFWPLAAHCVVLGNECQHHLGAR